MLKQPPVPGSSAAAVAMLLLLSVAPVAAAMPVHATDLPKKAATLVNKPITVSGLFAGSSAAFTPPEKEAGYSERNMLKLLLRSTAFSVVWARSAVSIARLEELKPGDPVAIAGKIRKKTVSAGERYFLVVDRVERSSAPPPPATTKKVPVYSAPSRTAFATIKAGAPAGMSFVAARRLAMAPETYLSRYVATEASFHTVSANLGEGPSTAEFPATSTLRVETDELPFPILLEKSAATIDTFVDLPPGTPVAVWGKLIDQPGRTYVLAAVRFEIIRGRKKPKTK